MVYLYIAHRSLTFPSKVELGMEPMENSYARQFKRNHLKLGAKVGNQQEKKKIVYCLFYVSAQQFLVYPALCLKYSSTL